MWSTRIHRTQWPRNPDRKSTRLNSSHSQISYAVFCLKKKKSKRVQNRCSKSADAPRVQNSIRLNSSHSYSSLAVFYLHKTSTIDKIDMSISSLVLAKSDKE